jgi:predicted nucleic acid-binding Zn ribbon protein
VRRHAPRPLAVAVDGLTGGLAPTTPLARVQREWPNAVGDAIAREAQPVGERDGTLVVECRSSVWAQELDLMAPDLLRRLNEALGDELVRDLRCRATGARSES